MVAEYSKEWWYPTGEPAASVQAIVFEGDQSTLASIFSDSGLTTPLTNPTTTDSSGVLTFYAASGDYWVYVGDDYSGDSELVTLGPAVTGAVLSVNGQTGVVVLDAGDVGADPAGSAAAAAAASQPLATINAKGDLYAGTADNTTTRQPVGTDGQVLRAASGQSTGLEWDTLTAPDVGALSIAGGTIIGDLTVQGSTTATYEGITLDVMEALSTNLSTGVIYGGQVTVNVIDDTTVDITAGLGYIVDYATDPMAPTVTRVVIPAQSGVPMSGASLARQITTWAMDSSGTLLQIDPPTNAQDRKYLILGNTAQIGPGNFVSTSLQLPINQPLQQTFDLMKAIGPFIASGNLLQPIPGGLTFTRTAGTLFSIGENAVNDINNPHLVDTPAASPQLMIYATQVAGSAEVVPHDNVYPGSYDVGGVVTPIPGSVNRATVQRLWYFPAGSGGVVVQYGQEWYNSLDEAILGMNTQDFIENPNLRFATLLGALVVTKGCTDLSDPATARFFSAVKFRASFVGSTIGVTVFSVNGETGNVILDAADVGADPAGSAAAAQAASQPLDADLTQIAGLTPSNDDVLQRKAGAWTNRSVAQYKTDLAYTAAEVGAIPLSIIDAKGDLIVGSAADTAVRLPPGTDGHVLTLDSAQAAGVKWAAAAGGSGFAPVVKPRAGQYVQAGAIDVIRSSKAATLNAMYLRPFVLTDAATLVAMAFELTNSTVGAVARLGIYASDSDLLPDARIVDFGQFTADTSGLRAVTGLSQALSANTLYWAAICAQVAAPNMRHSAGFNPWVASTALPTGTGAGWNSAYVETGVSGALPANTGVLVSTDAPALGIGF